jgi:cytochrome P450
MTIVLAGHETTANALAWAWFLLSKDPSVARKLFAEVRSVLGDRSDVTFEDIGRLRYTRMVIDEAIRLYPPAWMFGRRAIAEDELRGVRIPPGSLVVMGPFFTHRHPDFWPNPEGFDPERFTPEAIASRPKYAYFPFGGGPRVCIGNNFAIFEAIVVLAMTARRYRFDLLPEKSVSITPEALITLRPKGGITVTVHERRTEGAGAEEA